eukprot:CAMPEP_0202685682 /NCGR_PEP_ID=MMETSP1385-20130828/1504_1 /ASSEMBLY_ACC=CAM_ASM_000861 /TAXON_ID=933848 /ORGANISM="Elphidium margaritaceum" /LENGTH=420 /DNA_ID=CAMNT_0049340101 /DNA_START=1505 /DNA_END=2763 /DNA_ORIENTATION=+
MTSPFSHEFKITDATTLTQIKTASFQKQFKGSVFSAFGMRWYLDVYPNGYREPGFVELFLNLPSFPPKLKAFEIALTLQCLETDTKHERTATFDSSEGTGWPKQILAIDQIDKCDTLTFVVGMELIAVYDVMGDDVTDVYVAKHEQAGDAAAPAKYEHPWKITDAALLEKMKKAPMGEEFRSSIFSAFGFRWNLAIYPNGQRREAEVDLYLQLLSLPPKLKSVNVAFTLRCLQTGAKHVSSHEWERACGVGWRNSPLSTAEFVACDELTFVVNLELIAVYDLDGDDITEWHLQGKSKPKQDQEETKQDKQGGAAAKARALLGGGRPQTGSGQNDPLMAARLDSLSMNMNKMMQRMAAIELSLNEEEKEPDKGRVTQTQFTELQQQVNGIQKTLKQLMMKDMDPEEMKFKAWLDSVDGLAA